MPQQMDYGQEDMGENDEGQPGMFGNRGDDGDAGEENDEYFDDAGDIGYLPADHVSFIFLFLKNHIYLKL